MKIAISVPDETFERATRRARELGISRSEFFATAAARYLSELDRSSLTRRIDDALAVTGPDDGGEHAVAAGHRRLTEPDW